MSKFDKDIVKVPFTNSLKQVLNPGDEVVVVTSGYNKQINIRRGTYLGRYKKEDGSVSCIVDRPVGHWRNKSTGQLLADAELYGRLNKIQYPAYRSYFDGHKYGTPEYSEAQVQYQAAQKAVEQEREAIIAEYEHYDESAYFRTTLQSNRVFKLDTNAWEMKI